MCAAVADVDPAGNAGAGKDDDMVTIWSEGAILFKDDGERRDFAPGAAARAMAALREQQENREFCDVAFRTSDGSEIWAHRFVMASKYSGCYALFALAKEGMTAEQQWLPPMRLVVEDLGSDMVQLLVDFAYRAQMHERVGLHNVGEVLKLADQLKLSWLRNHCVDVLRENLTPECCIQVYRLSSSCGCKQLASEAFRYLVRNFDQVWRHSADFETLTPEEFHAIIEDDRLHAPNEFEVVFNAIVKWISVDVTTRKVHLAKLLSLVRLGRCSVRDFDKLVSHPEVQRDADSVKVLSVIHQSLTLSSLEVREVAGVDLSHRTWLKPRLPKSILFLFGGWTVGATNVMHTYNCRAARWRAMGNQYTPPRSYHGMAVINQCIYVVGGFNGRECYHSVVCFDVRVSRWSAKANMNFARCYVSVAVLEGAIYAMGGFDARMRLRSVERYDIKRNNWTQLADMNDHRSDASAAASRGLIYIAGGFTGISILDTVESYDPSTNVWTQLLSMPWRRSGHKLLAHEDAIFIIGGFNGVGRVSSVAVADMRTGRYTLLPSMPTPKSNFAATVLDGHIYVIGGFSAGTTVQTVERYDIEARKWYPVSEIDVACSAAAACVVEDVANVEPWI